MLVSPVHFDEPMGFEVYERDRSSALENVHTHAECLI
jgi:hypothetical protein